MKIDNSRIFEVFESKSKGKRTLFTKNLAPGTTVYDEILIKSNGEEYRSFDPRKSKLAAAIEKGCLNIGIRKNDKVLYLGCSTGTTPSHISDIVGKEGFIFGLDSSPRVLRDFVFLCEKRQNMAALLENASQPQGYQDKVCTVDIIYQDIAQKDQADIFLKNCKNFLKKGGFGLFAVKARSIDVTKPPRQIFALVRQAIEKELVVIDFKTLDPFERDHCMFICKKNK